MSLPNWVRLPSGWIESKGLRHLRWKAGAGAGNTAALMALMAIAHRMDRENGLVSATYDVLCEATSLSRATLSRGLDVLEALEVVKRMPEGRSTYQLMNFDPERGWAMLPAKGVCDRKGRITAFGDFHLRRPAELNALKLYFLFVARRDRETNMASISYDKIEDYTGMERHRIKSALSLLATHAMVHVERLPSRSVEEGYANAYRLVGLDAYNHRGTRGRGQDTPPQVGLASTGAGDDFF